jgi:hypothetical protein
MHRDLFGKPEFLDKSVSILEADVDPGWNSAMRTHPCAYRKFGWFPRSRRQFGPATVATTHKPSLTSALNQQPQDLKDDPHFQVDYRQMERCERLRVHLDIGTLQSEAQRKDEVALRRQPPPVGPMATKRAAFGSNRESFVSAPTRFSVVAAIGCDDYGATICVVACVV